MKSVLFIILMIYSGIAVGQEIVEVKSKVVDVTLFRDRALITREAKVKLSSGKSILKFSELVSTLQDNSVRVSTKNPNIKILDVKVERKFTVDSKQKRIQIIQSKIDSFKILKGKILDRIALQKSKENFVESLKAKSLQYYNQKMLMNMSSTKDWNKMLQFVENNLSDIYSSLRKGNNRINDIEKEIRVLKKEINSTGGTKQDFKEIYVTIENKKNSEVVLTPSYMVNEATWYPLYDSRVFTSTKEMELVYYGMIQQSTGEDWKDVNLTLSTANPQSIQIVPELDKWFLSVNPIPKRRTLAGRNKISYGNSNVSYIPNRGLPSGIGTVSGYVFDQNTGEPLIGANVMLNNSSLGSATDINGKFYIKNVPNGNYNLIARYIGYDQFRTRINVVEKNSTNLNVELPIQSLAVSEVVVTSQKPLLSKDMTSSMLHISSEEISNLPKRISKLDGVSVSEKELSTTFEIETKYSIPSDNNQHKVTITRNLMPMIFERKTIPKLNPKVYLNGKVTNNNQYPLLEGEINVFVDNDFVTRTFTKDIVPSDTLTLALGIDENISVKKVLNNRYVETHGLFTSEESITYDYEIHITNKRKTNETINVIDQIPIETNEDIKVTLLNPKKDIETLGKDRKLEWIVELKPGEKRVINIKYRVEYPKGISVYGLE